MEQEVVVSILEEIFYSNIEFTKGKDRDYFSGHFFSQSPVVTLLTCSDSRVQPNIFSKNPINKVFSVRNIGNQIDSSKASLDYGIFILKTPVFFILAHTNCGAVNASLELEKLNLPESIKREIAPICCAVSNISDENIELLEKQQRAVEENLDYQIMKAMEYYGELVESGHLTVVGGIYDFMNYYNKGYGKVLIKSINGIKGGSLFMQPVVSQLPDDFKFEFFIK